MKLPLATIATVALLFVCSTSAQAQERRIRWTPIERPATILPTRAELRNFPAPERGRLIGYPVDVVHYGATIHPGARIARSIIRR